MGSGAKSYMRNGFLYEVRRSLVIYDFGPDPSQLVYEEKHYFISVDIGKNSLLLLLKN
jgi:hypothetical protein